MKAKYKLTIKDGSVFTLAKDGTILHDGERNMGPFSGEWKIIGITRRHHSHFMLSLEYAANGGDLGQGWIHDLDHGTRRIWGMPLHHRAVRVEAV